MYNEKAIEKLINGLDTNDYYCPHHFNLKEIGCGNTCKECWTQALQSEPEE